MFSILLAEASEAAESALLSAGEGGSAAKKMGERDTDELVVVLSRRSNAGTVILDRVRVRKAGHVCSRARWLPLLLSLLLLELHNINYSVM